MTAEPGGDGLAAALIQISGHAERIAALDAREASHRDQLASQIRALAADVTAVAARADQTADAISRQAAIFDGLDGLDQQVAALSRQVGQSGPGDDGDNRRDPGVYQPIPAPRWRALTGPGRDAAVARLGAWVDQVYRPGYGQLAAALPACWEHHPLCLHMLDWLSELWSVLYLGTRRDSAILAAQAEWQTRLLPAAAAQMAAEASNCQHSPASPWRRPPAV